MIRELLITKPSTEFVALARAFKSSESILELFKDTTQTTYPMPYFDKIEKTLGHEVWSSELNGSFHTPGFGEKYLCNKTLQNVQFVLLVPKAKAKDDILHLEIQVANDKGWEVQYRQGSKYVLYKSQQLSWHDAEKFCLERNGHLASVESWLETNQLGSGHFLSNAWIGGSDIVRESVWTWSDGTPWPIGPTCDSIRREHGDFSQPCTSWARNQPSGGATRNCLSIAQNNYKDSKCDEKKDFVCKFNPPVLITNQTLAIKKSTKGFSKVEFWLKKRFFSSSTTCNASQNIPGFLINWGKNDKHSTGKEQQLGVYEIFDMLSFNDSILREAHYYRNSLTDYNMFLSKTVRYGIVKRAKGYNMTNDELWHIVKSFKVDPFQKSLFTCEEGVMKTLYFNKGSSKKMFF